MPLNTTIILELIALVISVMGSVWLRRKASSQDARTLVILYWLGFGLALLLLHFGLTPAWSALLVQPVFAGLTLLSPLILGLLALIFAAILRRSLKLPGNVLWTLLLSLIILGFLLALVLQPSGLFVALLPGALLLAGIWNFSNRRAVFEILLSLLFIIFLGLSSSGMAEPMFKVLPDWLGLILRPILFIQAGLVVLWAALLSFQAMEDFTHQRRKEDQAEIIQRRFYVLLRLGLALGLLVVLLITVFWVSLWDHTDDGMGGVWLAITGGLLAVAAGGLIVERRRGLLRLQGFLYLLLVPVLLFSAFGIGIKIPYHPISDIHAAIIQKALQSFYAQNARYPGTLEGLVPRQLLWVPSQLILRGEPWCYQGGQDYYRLGDFWRSSFSSLLEIRVYAAAGNPPEAGWTCQNNLVRMKFKYDPPPLYPGGQ